MTDLPSRALLRVEEVAEYFAVTPRTIYLWIEHKHLVAEKLSGVIRVTRESVLAFRLRSRQDNGPETT